MRDLKDVGVLYKQMQKPSYFFTEKSKTFFVYGVPLEFFRETKIRRKRRKISGKAKENNWLYLILSLILLFRAFP